MEREKSKKTSLKCQNYEWVTGWVCFTPDHALPITRILHVKYNNHAMWKQKQPWCS